MSPDSDRLRWKALALLCVANFMVILDAQIVILGLLYAQQVLGFSALEFGLATVVMTVGTVIGSMLGQALVTRVGPGAVASAGLTLTGLGLLVLTQVSVGGSYFGDIFVGILIFGPGLGATFVAASVATLAGVPERESGLASGLNTASFQIGGAFGSAVVTTVAVSAAAGSGDPLTLTEGYQSAFAAAIAFPVLGVVFALTLLTRLKPSPKSTPARSSPVMPSRGWDPVRRRY